MKELAQRDALKIHDLILKCGDTELVAAYQQALKVSALSRFSGVGMQQPWIGHAMPEALQQTLDQQFGLSKLSERNLVKGEEIAVQVLANAQPDVLLEKYFDYDPAQEAAKRGIDYDALKTELKAAFRGTVGRPGDAGFGLLFDKSLDTVNLFRVPLASNIRKAEPHQLEPKGLEAGSANFLPADYNPAAMKILAGILNFQGASYYLPKEKQA